MKKILRLDEFNANSYPGGRNKYFADYEDLADYIVYNGEDNYLDITDYGYASEEHGPVVGLSVDTDINDTKVVFVHFMDDETYTLDDLDDEDLTLALFSEFIF